MNYGSTEQEINLGSSNFKQNISNFIQKSYITEATRSGNYLITDDKEESDYYCTVIIDSVETFAFFSERAFVHIGGFRIDKNVSSGMSLLNVGINFYNSKTNELVLEDELKIVELASFVNLRSKTDDVLFQQSAINITESLSMVIRECVSKIVEKSNEIVESHYKNLK